MTEKNTVTNRTCRECSRFNCKITKQKKITATVSFCSQPQTAQTPPLQTSSSQTPIMHIKQRVCSMFTRIAAVCRTTLHLQRRNTPLVIQPVVPPHGENIGICTSCGRAHWSWRSACFEEEFAKRTWLLPVLVVLVVLSSSTGHSRKVSKFCYLNCTKLPSLEPYE